MLACFFTFDLKTIARFVRSRHLTLFRKEIKHSTYPTLISKEPFSQFGILPITFSFLISRTALRPKGTRILKVQVRLLSSVKPEWWTIPFGALYSDGGHLVNGESPMASPSNVYRLTGTLILKVQVELLSSVKPEWWTIPFGTLYSDGGHLVNGESRMASPLNIFLDCWYGCGIEGGAGAIHMRMRLQICSVTKTEFLLKISSRQVMKIKENINWEIISWSNTKSSKLTS